MFQIADVESESRKIIGTCSDELFFAWCSDAIALVGNKGEFNAWQGFIDICSCGKGNCITLPREVQTVLAVNVCGKPMLAKSSLFEFHLNGAGSGCKCEHSWEDRLDNHSTYRDIVCPTKLVVFSSDPADDNSQFLVHGFDDSGNKLRHVIGGDYRDGLLVPVIFGYAIPSSDAPKVARITGITKQVTKGSLRLSTIDDSGDTGILLSVLEPDERYPQYRRIKLNKCAPWFTVAYRKTNPVITSRYDRVPLKSRLAFLFAIHALNRYRDLDLGAAHSFEADAARLEIEAQNVAEPPTYHPVMVVDWNQPQNKDDFDIR